MKLHILIVSNGTIPVNKYGGIERVIWHLGKELAAMGHRITFLVGAGSKCDFGEVLPYNPDLPVSSQVPDNVDIVHSFLLDWDSNSKPFICTVEINTRRRKIHQNSVFVSGDHAKRYGSNTFVYNGLGLEDYGTPDFKVDRTYMHFLGKAAWKVKNLRGCIDIARKSNNKLMVMGGNRINFNMGIKIYTARHIRFAGMVGGERKNRLINKSKALLFPVLWSEPFGIAITESLYFGCPVFGTPYGSLPELITPEFGFLSDKKTEIVDALKHIDQYDRKKCHEYVCEKFSSKQMAEKYLLLYEKVMNGQKLNSAPPKLLDPDLIDKLPFFD